MEENVATKKCTTCGRELPVSEFYKNAKSKDGLQSKCKSCMSEYNRAYNRTEHLNKVYLNPDLAKFQPRELIAELRARGYSRELSYTQIVVV
jgi:NAD-dependent SIR2 family protein deacetylase